MTGFKGTLAGKLIHVDLSSHHTDRNVPLISRRAISFASSKR